MVTIRTALALTALAVSLLPAGMPAQAQQQQQWFIPGQQQQQQQQRPPAQQQRPAAQAPRAPQGQVPGPTEPGAPRLPPLDRAPPPPAAVIGVIGVQEVFEASVAVREVRQTLQRRLAKLQEDSAREQQKWRDAQQALASQRGQLTPEQLREKERELQEQITNGQRILRERNAAIQAAGQKALAEVERVLLYVIRQVAEARGLTMVVQRQAIVLAVEEHDISEAVANQLNRALTTVPIDPDPAEAEAPAPAQGQRAPAQPQRRN
jgi:Skp family chaperone for outer membrane proteins